MIDNQTVRFENHRLIKPNAKPFYFKGFCFTPDFHRSTGKFIGSSAKINNLYVKATDSAITVSNSIHKFGNSNNYGDFNYSDLEGTLYSLDDFFEGQYLTGTITQIEYGVNLTGEEPLDDVNSWLSYKAKEAIPNYSKGKPSGKSFVFEKYSFKGYNKTIEVKANDGIVLPNQITRIEARSNVNYLNKAQNNICITSVEDLLNKDVLHALSNDLFNKLKQVDRVVPIPYESLSVAQIKNFKTWLDIESRNAIKAKQSDRMFRAYKSDARKIKKLCYSDYDLASATKKKFEELISTL